MSAWLMLNCSFQENVSKHHYIKITDFWADGECNNRLLPHFHHFLGFHCGLNITCCEPGHLPCTMPVIYSKASFLALVPLCPSLFFTLCPLTCAGRDNFLASLSTHLQ